VVSRLVPFPPISQLTLENGLSLSVVARRRLPLTELRLVLDVGSSSDGNKPGQAQLGGQLLKAGGAGALGSLELAKRVEDLGSELEIETGPDSTELSMLVTSGNLQAAMDLLGDVVVHPRLDAREFDRLKQRKIEQARTSSLSDAGWEGSMVLFQRLRQARGRTGQRRPCVRCLITPRSSSQLRPARRTREELAATRELSKL
jgi:predicted Zn-dependent peptidase